ncbi:MAG: FtsX-like permease family protein [candidate division WOR-3 bacterium]|nr:FtsX-like permease family protein [candidate division WOR-3 bacterium]
MRLVYIAWRNVFRHTRRTIITAAAISVGLSSMIFMNTMMNGADKMASRNIIDFETSHMEIFAEGYYREEGVFPLDTIIEDQKLVTDKIKGMSGISGMTPRVKFQASISNGIDELPVLGMGVDIENDNRIFKIGNSIAAGTYLQNEGDVLIGTNLASDMDLDVGSYLTIITKDRNGTYNAYDLTVSGIINTGHPLFDRNMAIISIAQARDLLAIGQGMTELCIRANDENKLAPLKEKISRVIGKEYEVLTWKEMNAAIFEISGFKRAGQFMIALVVVVIAAVGIVNTMLMAVMERVPEIGTLKAMGFSNTGIVKMFLYEGGIIGIFGSLLGCLLGLLVSIYLVHVGLDFSSVFENMDIVYPMKFIIKGEIDYLNLVYVFLFGIFVSIGVTLWPVRRATKLEAVDALRHV